MFFFTVSYSGFIFYGVLLSPWMTSSSDNTFWKIFPMHCCSLLMFNFRVIPVQVDQRGLLNVNKLIFVGRPLNHPPHLIRSKVINMGLLTTFSPCWGVSYCNVHNTCPGAFFSNHMSATNEGYTSLEFGPLERIYRTCYLTYVPGHTTC